MSEIRPPQLPAWLCVPEAPLPACRSWDASARVSRPKPVQVSLRPRVEQTPAEVFLPHLEQAPLCQLHKP